MGAADKDGPLDHLDQRLREILDRLPRGPGVYLLKDHKGTIVYVGKAKSLFSRVRSYFSRASSDTRGFVPLLYRLVGDVETIVTDNEKEALLLENNLIKRHRPRFNVMLRDDKSYLVLRLDPGVPFPRLEVTRRIVDDGARYFGPYHSATSCRQTLRLINRHFQLRTCTDRTMASRRRPCLQHQIGRCPAPCNQEADEERYAEQVRDVTLFLRGRSDELIKDLLDRMQRAAARLKFELAGRLRDQISALESTRQGQRVVSDTLENQDAIGHYREGDRADMVVLQIREGKLVGRQPFSLHDQELPDDELLSGFISRLYDRAPLDAETPSEGEDHRFAPGLLRILPPSRILIPVEIEDRQVKEQWLSELSGRAVKILVPRRGKRRDLLELAARNARSNFLTRRQRGNDLERSLARLERRLRLSRPPRRVECFDISSIQEQHVVASMVTMEDGELRRERYKRFKIRSSRKDDFSSMYEVICRRLARAREGSADWELPDLIVVDGGKGQLSMALAALKDVGVPEGAPIPDMVGLAKERTPHGRPASAAHPTIDVGEPPLDEEQEPLPERVYIPHAKEPRVLRPHAAETYLLTLLRDEAHRFAITFHKELRRRRGLRSDLEAVPGIGPARRKALLKAFGSVKRIRQAPLDELAAAPGMTTRAAEAVVRYYARDERPGDDSPAKNHLVEEEE